MRGVCCTFADQLLHAYRIMAMQLFMNHHVHICHVHMCSRITQCMHMSRLLASALLFVNTHVRHSCMKLLASALRFVNTHVRHSCMYSDAVQARGACTCEVGQTTHEMGTQRMGSLCELQPGSAVVRFVVWPAACQDVAQ
jgi:hypothetical protein